jgi:hypothetical protein
MTRLAVAFLLLLASCGRPGKEDPEPIFVGDFPERALLAECQEIDSPYEGTPTTLRSVGDTAFLVDFAMERRTLLLDQDLRARASVSYRPEGPRAITEVRDLALVEDTVILYADRPAQRLRRIGLGGSDLGEVGLSFPPESILPLEDGVLVARTVLIRPADPLLRITNHLGAGSALETRPFRIPDPQLQTLANLLILLPRRGGGAVGIHQFLSPFARLVSPPDPAGNRDVRTVPVPLTEGLKPSYGWYPKRPFADDDIMRILTPALAADVDRRAGHFLILTRSGSDGADFTEKAVIRLDGEMGWVGAVRLPVNAGQMVFRGRDQSVIVIDEFDRWHRCDAP